MPKLGITGTQSPGPNAGYAVRVALNPYPRKTIIVQGCCIGMDHIATMVARDMGFDVWGVVPANRYKVSMEAVALCSNLIYMPPGTSYMQRNDELVRIVDSLIGFPQTADEELRSGTWATIRRAWRKFGRDNVDIIPVGDI